MTLEFTSWYRDAHPRLVAAVRRAIADHGVASDAVDEAVAKAFERWDTVATLRSPTGWVYTVAINAARRTFRRRTMEDERWARTTVERVAAAAEQGLADAIGSLTARQQEMLRLRHEEARTEADIAARLGITRSTVSSTLNDAYERLAALLRTAGEHDMMKLQLARVRAGHADGCDVAYLDVDVTERAAYAPEVLDTIRIRRHDLVAVDTSARPAVIVWRWWHGTIDSVDRDTATVTRPAGDNSTATVQVGLPAGLQAAARPGADIWFGRDGDQLVVVALAGHTDPAKALLPQVEAAYE